MGFYDRDYYRAEPVDRGFFGGAAPGCKWLIAITAVVYVAQILTFRGPGGGVGGWLMMLPEQVVSGGQVWRLATYALCHDPDTPLHLLFNMWMLWLCGSQVEPIYGTREFVRFYIAGAILAGIAYLAFGFGFSHPAPMLGASGAVMAVTVVCAMYYPTQRILIFFVIPLELRWMVILAAIFDVYPLLQVIGGKDLRDHVAHAAHLGGLLYGFLYKRYDLRFSRLFSGLNWLQIRQRVRTAIASRRKNVRLYQPPPDAAPTQDLDRQVDAILAKITAQGEASLTDRERDILKEASRRYRHR
ncbi:MAG: rhomboid family intramembrane serine protease [Planctomycetales bacterium]